MKRICCLIMCLSVALVLLLCIACAAAPKAPARGFAVLASSIGTDCSPEDLAEFVQRGKFSPVVVDWAWITYHWGYTDYAAVNRFLDLMAAKKVPVAAMYRPRFISSPTVPTQVGEDGKQGMDHTEICYSDKSARKWGASWGVKILQKCPSFKEIIIYNPTDTCRCAKCTAAKAKGQYRSIVSFLSEAKTAWRAKQPGVKLGVVAMPDVEFWKTSLPVVDIAHPYLLVREELDPSSNIADIKAMRSIARQKMGSCLAKITWEEGAKVSMAKLESIDSLAAKSGIPYFFWTFDTLFKSSLYDPREVAQTLDIDLPAAFATNGSAPAQVAKSAPESNLSGGASNLGNTYTPEQIRNTSAETFLERMANPEPGYWQFAALNALAQKARESDANGRRAIVALATQAMYDQRRSEFQRFQCCYVISDCGDDQGVPDLIKVLLNDPSEVMRSVAAEALGKFPSNLEAHNALLKSAEKEQSPRVREVLERLLGKACPAPGPSKMPVNAQPATGPVKTPLNGQPSTSPFNGSGPEGKKMYTPEQYRQMSAETLLARMVDTEPGYWQFAALNALADKARESETEARRSILATVTAAMFDKRRTEYQRFQCCYVLSGSKDEQVVPDLILVLFGDPSEVMRSVAVEALADFPNCAAAHNALLKAAEQETSERVREVLARRLGQPLPQPKPGVGKPVSGKPVQGKPVPVKPAPKKPIFHKPIPRKPAPDPVPELAPSGAPVPPPAPMRPVAEPLSWPFDGDSKAQCIFNNYQTATDDYIHGGLDFIHPAGTPVKAVGSGYVAAIANNYPDWITHYFFIVTPVKGGNRGWCYTHMDPRTFTFKEGDYIREGQVLGKLVKFSVGSMPGMDHLHLHYVSFTGDSTGKVSVHSLIDPLYFFDWQDTEPPAFLPLWFAADGSSQQFERDSSGITTVGGKVDILAAISDSSYQGERAYLGVPVVMLSISDGKHTVQKLVLDHRGDIGDERQVAPLYLSRDEAKKLVNTDSFFPFYQVLRVTKTNGDGKIDPQDASECWDTTAQDESGRPLWPNGQYNVKVYVWDIAGNRASVGAKVVVRN